MPLANFHQDRGAAVAYLTDRDLNRLVQEIDNETMQIALFDCDPFVRERIFTQFSYAGMKAFEIDRKALAEPSREKVAAAQSVIIEILNDLIRDHLLEDFHNIKVA